MVAARTSMMDATDTTEQSPSREANNSKGSSRNSPQFL